MAEYNVTITNGQGSKEMKAGTYSAQAISAPGYDLTTLSPTSITVNSTSQTHAFTLSASGTLTLIFNETGAAGGKPITSGSVVMTNQDGTIEYGSPVSINSVGTAIFENVPYGSSEAPFTLYFKQLATDDYHNIYTNVITVSMSGQTQTNYVQNTPIAEQNFTLTDANYPNLPIPNATLNFETNE